MIAIFKSKKCIGEKNIWIKPEGGQLFVLNVREKNRSSPLLPLLEKKQKSQISPFPFHPQHSLPVIIHTASLHDKQGGSLYVFISLLSL